MKNYKIYLCLFLAICFFKVDAQQGYHLGIKGGLTIANQTWNQGERRPSLLTHANFFVETRDKNNTGSLFAQLGYHSRGSGIRFFNAFSGQVFGNGYRFNNLSLLLGAKRKFYSKKDFVPYYLVGIRAEYTVNNNLDELLNTCLDFQSIEGFFCPYPEPIFANNVVYGISIGGGLEFKGSEFFNPALEFTVSPDIGLQLNQPELSNPPLRQARVRNISFEISLVLRFLREIVYEE